MTRRTKRPKRARGAQPLDAFMAPAESARAASLVYISDDRAGITRHGAAPKFRYRNPDGSALRDATTLDRIRALAIPPAWTDVWISPTPNGHLQATGRDARGRKQYRYHVRWRQVRDETKYERLLLFGSTLPRIRTQVDAHLDLPAMPREKLLAVVVRLLETTFMRVGNDEYARTNDSYGLTTLQDHHVDVQGARLSFTFRGKAGKHHAIVLNDRRLARLVRRCRDLPGQDLFQYMNDDGTPQPITSADVNAYLREISGNDFTAKDFRTWAGTMLAASRLPIDRGGEQADSPSLVGVIKEVAEQLGNTPTVCRKCYIHPAVLAAFQDDNALDRWRSSRAGRAIGGLTPAESSLLRFLGG